MVFIKKNVKRKYKDASEQREATLRKLLSNKTKDAIKNKDRQLSAGQLKTLNEYIDFYQSKNSSRGGKMKIASALAATRGLREFGLYIKQPYEDVEHKGKVTKQDLIKFIKHLQREGKEISSISRLKVNIRSFYKWMHGITKKHEFPEVCDDPLLEPENTRKKKKKVELPTKDDIIKLVNACYNNQHKAIIMVLSESGARAEEITSANLSSLEFDEKGARFFTETSKSKERYIRLIHSVPFLQTWLQEHPFVNNNPNKSLNEKLKRNNNPLFVSFRRGSNFENQRLLPHALTEIIKRVQKRVPELKDLRLYAHLLRHFAITERWKEGMRTESNSLRHGITTATLRDVYLHLDNKDASDEYDELQGIEESDEEKIKKAEERKKLAPKKCSYCNEINPFSFHYCKACNRPLDVTGFTEVDENKDQLLQWIIAVKEESTKNPGLSIGEINEKVIAKINVKP